MILRARVLLLGLLFAVGAALSADDTPAPRITAPERSLEDAVRIARDYVAQQKWDTSSHFLRSVYFIGGGSHSYWAVTWVPKDRFLRDGQFTVKIAMDRSVMIEGAK